MAYRKTSLFGKLAKLTLFLLIVVIVTPLLLTILYRAVPPPITPLMVIRLFEGEGIKKDWVPLSRISPHAIRAVLALEDTRFCLHNGVDWEQVQDAVADRLQGGRLRGASTISMQTAKNLFLWPGRTYLRKAIEAPLTFLIEWAWDKRRIMEIYMNVVEWGPGIYGIEAAARAYFQKPAARLTKWESGLLAAVLPNPRKRSPRRATAFLRDRAGTAMARSAILGPYIKCVEK